MGHCLASPTNCWKMDKKAQIRIGESIAILFIFLIFIAIGFGFYGKLQKASFSSQRDESVVLQAIGVVQIATFLPELQCSSKNVVVDNCLDTYIIDYWLSPVLNTC